MSGRSVRPTPGLGHYESVYRRILAGLPGSPMPSSKYTPEEVGQVTRFVLSLSDEEQREGVVMTRREVTAARVPRIPALDAPDWGRVKPVALKTMPLWWRNEFATAVDVQAVHDGTTLALRLQWSDTSADVHALQKDQFEDMVAVEFYRGNDEPFLAMGGPGTKVDLWQWRGAGTNAGGLRRKAETGPYEASARQLAAFLAIERHRFGVRPSPTPREPNVAEADDCEGCLVQLNGTPE